MVKVFFFFSIKQNIHKFEGKYVWPDDRFYDGMWFRSKMHGKGKFSWPNGNLYEGDYNNDKREGMGTYIW